MNTTTTTIRGIITRRYKTLNPASFNPSDYFMLSTEDDGSHPVLYILRTESGKHRVITGYGHAANYNRQTKTFDRHARIGDRMVVTVDNGRGYRDLAWRGEEIVGIVEVTPSGTIHHGEVPTRALPRWFMD